MKVAVLSPTTSQFVEKMAVLFPEGIDLVGPQSDNRHDWNNCHLRLDVWRELGLKVNIIEQPYKDVSFRGYDLLIESAETFQYCIDWSRHCLRVECPILLKACWSKSPTEVLPSAYIKTIRKFPVLLEMPAHVSNWKAAGFRDVNLIPNPVGGWWFRKEWTGNKEQVLFVLSGSESLRPADRALLGMDLWERLCERFPGKTHHHDGHKKGYKTPKQMAEMFSESRVFVNLDSPYCDGERPLTLAFTEALSAGLPVAARDLPGLSYRMYIDSNGFCSNDFETICAFLDKCLTDIEYARKCSLRSREIGRQFSFDSLRPKYARLISRAQSAFADRTGHSKGAFGFLRSWVTSCSDKRVPSGVETFDRLAELYGKQCPPGYDIEARVCDFYSSGEYWERFREWERTQESYSIRDKAFVESALCVNGADVVNIGCFYPWAEMEWGQRARQWTAIDINSHVIERAWRTLAEYAEHRVTFMKWDVTTPLDLGRRVDCVLDLSTGDQLDPRKLWTVLCNYMKLSDMLLLAYDATQEPLAVFDFGHYGFNALYNPRSISAMLSAAGYKILDHRPFSYLNRSYVAASLLPARDRRETAPVAGVQAGG